VRVNAEEKNLAKGMKNQKQKKERKKNAKEGGDLKGGGRVIRETARRI